MNGDRQNVREEILSNKDLQKQLRQKHKQGVKEADIYMATYVEMLEEHNFKKYFRQRDKQFSEQGVRSSNDDEIGER